MDVGPLDLGPGFVHRAAEGAGGPANPVSRARGAPAIGCGYRLSRGAAQCQHRKRATSLFMSRFTLSLACFRQRLGQGMQPGFGPPSLISLWPLFGRRMAGVLLRASALSEAPCLSPICGGGHWVFVSPLHFLAGSAFLWTESPVREALPPAGAPSFALRVCEGTPLEDSPSGWLSSTSSSPGGSPGAARGQTYQEVRASLPPTPRGQSRLRQEHLLQAFLASQILPGDHAHHLEGESEMERQTDTHR